MYPYSMNSRTRRNIHTQLNKKPPVSQAPENTTSPENNSGSNNSNNNAGNFNNGGNNNDNCGNNGGFNNNNSNNNNGSFDNNNSNGSNGSFNNNNSNNNGGFNNNNSNNNGGFNNNNSNNNDSFNDNDSNNNDNFNNNNSNNTSPSCDDNPTTSRPVVNRYILEMIKSALSDEAADADYYERLANLVECPEDNTLIHKIRSDEVKHYNILSNIFYELTGSKPEEAEFEMIELKPNISENFASSIIDELESASFYNKLMFSFLNIELRDWFSEIMTDEQAHAQIMNYLFSKYTN